MKLSLHMERKNTSTMMKEWQIGYIHPKSKGESNNYKNAEVLSRKENRDKWDG
ncbi:hypothetical protein [Paenibacillus agilis]|uniref:hypothetical protein n=1 Tax=Paenibacillus agilis TaxID=3020863 RepID=UPI00164984D9|nr:hypothetical protein [Paenibacillus agilis]